MLADDLRIAGTEVARLALWIALAAVTVRVAWWAWKGK